MSAFLEKLWEIAPALVEGTPHARELGIKFVAVDKGLGATLSLRIDYQRAAKPGKTVMAEAVCYKTTRHVAFIRAIAHDGDPDDPVATAQSCFMLTGPLYKVPSKAGQTAGKEDKTS